MLKGQNFLSLTLQRSVGCTETPVSVNFVSFTYSNFIRHFQDAEHSYGNVFTKMIFHGIKCLLRKHMFHGTYVHMF